jgi:hypothetical protein
LYLKLSKTKLNYCEITGIKHEKLANWILINEATSRRELKRPRRKWKYCAQNLSPSC